MYGKIAFLPSEDFKKRTFIVSCNRETSATTLAQFSLKKPLVCSFTTNKLTPKMSSNISLVMVMGRATFVLPPSAICGVVCLHAEKWLRVLQLYPHTCTDAYTYLIVARLNWGVCMRCMVECTPINVLQLFCWPMTPPTHTVTHRHTDTHTHTHTHLHSCGSTYCAYHSLKISHSSLSCVRGSYGAQNLGRNPQLLRVQTMLTQLFWEEMSRCYLNLFFECVAMNLYHLSNNGRH